MITRSFILPSCQSYIFIEVSSIFKHIRAGIIVATRGLYLKCSYIVKSLGILSAKELINYTQEKKEFT